MPEIVSAFKDL